MFAAIIRQPGQSPVHGEIATPRAGDGCVPVRVSAAALSHVTRSRASGTHYSSTGAGDAVPGIDGVGLLPDGRRVYFVMPESPHGSMAEVSVVDPRHCIALPDEIDDVTAAAMAIPGMSSWAALKERTHFAAGQTVLVNGASGVSGGLAVQVAKRLGAGKVIATGRNPAALERLGTLGADATISLLQPPDALQAALQAEFAAGVDVVLDYLWGPSAEALLAAAVRAAPEAVPIRYVEIGAAGGADITLPSAALRSSAIELVGSGINSVPFPRLRHAIAELFAAAAQAPFEVPVEAVPLRRIGELWGRQKASPRIVFTMA